MWAILLEHGCSFLNMEMDTTGRTLFSYACFSMRPEMPILMLEYGANPNDKGVYEFLYPGVGATGTAD